jgi:hypothetical protein
MSQAEKAIKEAAISRPPIVNHIAPPYMGAGFSTVASPAAPPKFWSAVHHDVTRGGIVVQLGGQANPAPCASLYARAYAGFQYQFTASAIPAGYLEYSFGAKFNPGPVTVRNSGGNRVTTFCEVQFANFATRQQVVSNTPLTVYSDYYTAANEVYTVRVICGVEIYQFNPSVAPYGEVIIKDTDLQMIRYWTDPNDLQGKNEQAAMALSAMEPIIEEVGSIEEAKQKGLTGIF